MKLEEDYKSLNMEKEYIEDVVIYNLNKFIGYCNTSHNFEHNYDFEQHKEVAVYIENLLKRYKELEEELNSVKEIYYTQKEVETNYIPILVIQKKIDELKERISKMHPASDCVIIDDLENQIQVLQEILDERGK